MRLAFLEASIKGKSRIWRYMAISLHHMPMFEVKFLKNGSKFLNNTSFPLEENISFHINLVSQLDALVCEIGVRKNSKIRSYGVMSWKQLATFRYLWCFQILEFLRTPVSQTSASNWLTRFIWKEIFYSNRKRRIVQKFRAVFEKLDFKHTYVM